MVRVPSWYRRSRWRGWPRPSRRADECRQAGGLRIPAMPRLTCCRRRRRRFCKKPCAGWWSKELPDAPWRALRSAWRVRRAPRSSITACRTRGSPDSLPMTVMRRTGSRLPCWWSTAGMAPGPQRRSRGKSWRRQRNWDYCREVRQMNVGDFLERWGRALFEAPLAALPQPQEPPELAEIRLDVLDQLQAKTSSGGGRKVFLYDLLRVNLRGVPESSAPVFRGSFFRQYLEHEVKDALRNAGSRYPENLRVAIEVTAGVLPAGEPWLSVEPGQQEPASSRARPPAKLVVRAGSANVSELPIEKGRTHIGRSNDVIRSQGIFRRNDLVFSEDNDVSRSVSREHAHIDYDKTTGECRLFNDRWYKLGSPDCATWIVRDGLSHEVHRNGRGIKLEHGDEIHFGQAVVVFERLAS